MKLSWIALNCSAHIVLSDAVGTRLGQCAIAADLLRPDANLAFSADEAGLITAAGLMTDEPEAAIAAVQGARLSRLQLSAEAGDFDIPLADVADHHWLAAGSVKTSLERWASC